MQRLRDLAISESGFVFDPFSGATFTANGSALVMLDALKKNLGRAALCALVSRRFDTRNDDVGRDLDELVQTLRMHGLVPADFEVRA